MRLMQDDPGPYFVLNTGYFALCGFNSVHYLSKYVSCESHNFMDISVCSFYGLLFFNSSHGAHTCLLEDQQINRLTFLFLDSLKISCAFRFRGTLREEERKTGRYTEAGREGR